MSPTRSAQGRLDKARRQVAKLSADNAKLREALRKHCNGTREVSCTMCGDSTFEHECNDRQVPCPYGCGAALAETEDPS